MFPAFMVPIEVNGTVTAAPGQNGEPEMVPVVMVVVSPNVNALKVETVADVIVPEAELPVVEVLPPLVQEEPLQPVTQRPFRSGNASRPANEMVSVALALPDLVSA